MSFESFFTRIFTMTNRILIAGLMLAALSLPAMADETGMVGGAVAGAIVGGPVGAVVGGVVGNSMTNHHRHYHRYDNRDRTYYRD
jgi:outer membrane lipoprotein SlyB